MTRRFSPLLLTVLLPVVCSIMFCSPLICLPAAADENAEKSAEKAGDDAKKEDSKKDDAKAGDVRKDDDAKKENSKQDDKTKKAADKDDKAEKTAQTAKAEKSAEKVAKTEKPQKTERKPVKLRAASIVIKSDLSESAGAGGLFGELNENLREMVQRLDRAAQDDDISAIVLKLHETPSGRGRVAELREAIGRARKAGKKVVAEMQSGSSAEYLLACACDQIVMPESGTLMIPGVRAEVMFYKGLFDKLGIKAEMLQVGAYKGAAEPYTRTGMSPDFRKQFESLIDDMYEQLVETIAADRKLDQKQVRKLIDQGMLTALEAHKAGLIDTIAYGDQIEQRLRLELDADEVSLIHDYDKKEVDTDFSGLAGMMKMMELMMGGGTKSRSSSRPKVALVYAVGAITTGNSSASLFGEATVGSETIVKALREADKDDTVKAIVLRVDSPGGSALASDLIWREITRIEKPVIASMGDTAASGGYYISMGADKIFAEPGTLTGSIGVVGGKLAVGGLMDKVGVSTDVISRGKNASLLSMTDKFTDSERAVWKAMMEDTYRQFTTKAAAGRKMDLEDLDKLAGGRVWTGRQAKANGLVDELGTLRDALYAAKEAAGMKDDEKAELKVLPKPQSFLDELFGGPDTRSGVRSNVRAGAEAIDAVAPGLSRHLGDIETLRRLFAEPAVLMMPCRIDIR